MTQLSSHSGSHSDVNSVSVLLATRDFTQGFLLVNADGTGDADGYLLCRLSLV